MSLSRLWIFLALALPVLASLIAALSTVDLTYHLRAGAGILESGTIPTTETWTFTAAGLPWVDQQWGAQTILALVERVGGWTGLVVVRAALVGLIFGCLVVVGRARGLDGRTAALLSLAAFVIAAPALALRPQLLGMALFAVVLVLVVRRRTHPRALWLAPLVVLAWANVHGSFFLGPLVLGLAWLEDVHERVPRPHRTLAVAIVSGSLPVSRRSGRRSGSMPSRSPRTRRSPPGSASGSRPRCATRSAFSSSRQLPRSAS